MRGQRYAPAAPYPRERPGTLFTGGWVGLRAGLDWCGKTRRTGFRSPDRPARRQLLYRLRYPAHNFCIISCKFILILKFITDPTNFMTRQMFSLLHLTNSLGFTSLVTTFLLHYCFNNTADFILLI